MESLPTPSDWKQRVQKELGDDASFDDTLLTRTLEGIVIDPLYTDQSGTHGELMPRAGGWAITPRIEHPSPRAANERALEHLEGGASGLELDASRLLLGDAADVRQLLEGVLLDAVPISLTSQADALPLAALLLAAVEERDVAPETVALHFGMDPFAAIVRDGALPGDMGDARKELGLLASHSRLKLDRARTATADGSTWHRLGADPALELALATASFVEGLRWLEDAGLPPAAAHAEYVWRVDLDAEVFGGIAKCRAARALHARVLGAAGIEQATPLVLHATSSPRVLTRKDAWTNMLRASLSAVAGAAGGADLITTLPFDSALADASGGALEPSPLGRRMARNTQLVLQMESNLDHVGDPAGGGFYVEARTDALAREAWSRFQDIEKAGGMAACVESGQIDDLLGASRDGLASAYANGERHLVGVTAFPPPEGAKEPEPVEVAGADEARRTGAKRRELRGPVALGAVDDVPHAIRAAAEGASRDEIGGALVRGAAATRAAAPAVREEDLVRTEVTA